MIFYFSSFSFSSIHCFVLGEFNGFESECNVDEDDVVTFDIWIPNVFVREGEGLLLGDTDDFLGDILDKLKWNSF